MQLLTLQQPRSREAGAEAHDELLFIIVHQAYELWFKQILHEIDSVRVIFSTPPVNERLVSTCVHRLQRVTVIQQLLLQQVAVLETMRPIDFLDFRDYLYPASGFQSVQFRLLENRLGLRPGDRLRYGEKPYCSYLANEDADVVSASETVPSLHDLIQAWLERTPFLELANGEEVPPSPGVPSSPYREVPIDRAASRVTRASSSGGGGPVPARDLGAASGDGPAHVEAAGPDYKVIAQAQAGRKGQEGEGEDSFSWWEHYKQAVTSMLQADEAAILAHPALATTLSSSAPPGAQQGGGSGNTSTRDIALRDLAAARKHFDTVLDPAQYEEARSRGQWRLSYRALQAALLITLYSDEPIFQLPARLLGVLLDIDENMTAWRHRHAMMVHRMLGVKMGTGGSSGYHYLRATAERHRVFQDLFNLSTFLIPRQLLPGLPQHVKAKLDFAYGDEGVGPGNTAPGSTTASTSGSGVGVGEPGQGSRYRPQVGAAFAALTAQFGHLKLPQTQGDGEETKQEAGGSAGGAGCPMGFGQ